MIEVECEVKAWGNSSGVLIPKEIMEKENISRGDKIKMKFEKKNVLEEIRGALKGIKPRTNKSTDQLLAEFDAMMSKYD